LVDAISRLLATAYIIIIVLFVDCIFLVFCVTTVSQTRNRCNLIATHIGIIVVDSLKLTTHISTVQINTSFNMANEVYPEVYIVSADRTPIGKHHKYMKRVKWPINGTIWCQTAFDKPNRFVYGRVCQSAVESSVECFHKLTWRPSDLCVCRSVWQSELHNIEWSADWYDNRSFRV